MSRYALVLLAGLPFGSVLAADAAPAVAESCIECHRREDRVASLPQLEGQQPAYLRMELTHFRERHRQAFPMNAIAQDLSDADIAVLADWFAAQPWGAWRFAADPAKVAAGAGIADRFQCAGCHGPGFTGTDVVPRTAGQNPLYLARQLRSFARGDRYHPPTGTGARMFRLDEDEIAALSQFLAQLPGPAAPTP